MYEVPIYSNKNQKMEKEMEDITNLQNVVKKFLIHGKITKIEKVNKGYINSTYKVETLSANNHIHQYLL